MRTTLLFISIFGTLAAQDAPPLILKATIPLSRVEGRIDHFSADLTGHRIFMSALGNHSVEVIDAQSFRLLRSIPGFDEPQGLLFDSASKRLFVASAGDGTVKILDAATMQAIKTVKLGDNADNVRYDSTSGSIVVGYGSGALAILKADGTKSEEIALGGHPESFQLEREGHHLFVNVPGKQEIAVIDLDKRSVIDHWRGWQAQRNFPMALDEKGHRLFAGFRTPAQILAVDTTTGKMTASADIVGDTDDIFYDAPREWVYAIGGGGFVDILDAKDPAHFQRIAHIETAAGARTGLFVPEWNLLFIAVPKRGGREAEMRVYEVRDGK
jgi:YVTN family beta-propeller protein